MKLRKTIALASFLMACLTLASQSARASTVNVLTDQLTFLDLTDTVTFTFTGDPARIPASGLNCAGLIDICSMALIAPAGFLGPTGIISFKLGEGGLTGNVSDDFVGAVAGAGAMIKFGSASEATNLGPCVTPVFRLGAMPSRTERRSSSAPSFGRA